MEELGVCLRVYDYRSYTTGSIGRQEVKEKGLINIYIVLSNKPKLVLSNSR
jgi:hypothetical protein